MCNFFVLNVINVFMHSNVHTSPFSIRGTASFSSFVVLFKSSSGQTQPKKRNDMCLKIRRNKYDKCDLYAKITLMSEYTI